MPDPRADFRCAGGEDLTMQLSATVVLVVLGSVSFLCGVLVSVIISLMIGSARMKARAEEEATREGVMEGLSRSCDGIESTIASVNTNSIDAGRLRKEVLKRVEALDRRLSQYADTLDKYNTAYISLRLENYRQMIGKLDGLVADIARFGGKSPAADEAAPEAASAAAPVAEEPGLAAPMEPEAAPEAGAPVAEAAPEPVAPDVNVGATMSFDVLGMQGMDSGGEPVLSAAPAEAPPAPQMPDQQSAPAPEPEGQVGLSDEDALYGQTMQFSMTDIEAAKRSQAGAAVAQPEQVAMEPAPAEPEPQLSPAVSGDMGETIVFAVDEPAAAPAPEPEPAAAEPPQPIGGLMQMDSPPPEAPKPRPAKGKGEEVAAQGGLITGNDLMDQMDAFFNFKQ